MVKIFLDKVMQELGKKEKSVPLKLFFGFLRKIIKQKGSVPFVAYFFGKKLSVLGERKTGERIRILALNAERFLPDLQALASHPHIEVVTLPSSLQIALNAVWISKVDDLLKTNRIAYLQNKLPRIQEVRKALCSYLVVFLKRFCRWYGIDALVTCTYYYLQDRDWEKAAPLAGVPFYVLHKENMKDPDVNPIERHKAIGFSFEGTRLFVSNDFMRYLLLETNVCKEDQICIVGTPRVDTIFQKAQRGLSTAKRQVVLFSFRHCSGGVYFPGEVGGFNPKRDEGYVECFDLVHSAFAELAVENPDIQFVIKPKWMRNWLTEIKDAVKRGANLEVSEIPNLTITDKVSAYTLIEQSKVIVGINSTTLLEAKLFGRPVIVPRLAEAASEKYAKYLLFGKYMDAFTVAHSPDDLKKKILSALESTEEAKALPSEMIQEYLASYDGMVCERIYRTIQRDLLLKSPILSSVITRQVLAR